MTLSEFLPLLQGVSGSGKQYSAKCPAHDDNKASLSIAEAIDGRILINCHAGCSVTEICDSLGLKTSDLFQKSTAVQDFKSNAKPTLIATYEYKDLKGVAVARKLRYSNKSFCWLKPDGKGGWIKGRNGQPPLYNQLDTIGNEHIYVVEGEKDVDTLKQYSQAAVSLPDGAKSKWLDEYTNFFEYRKVAIIQDNDEPGKKFAQMVAEKLQGVADSVKIIDLAKIWHNIPEHADVSDYILAKPKDGLERLSELVEGTGEWNVDTQDSFLSCFKTLDTFEEEEATWLIPGWLPEGQITLLASDGGIGKTTLWCNIITALSNGTNCVIDPTGYKRNPMKVAFLTTEDSVRKKLKRKLRLAGANEQNIITPDFLADKDNLLRNMKFGSNDMERFIKYFKPALCVFDPVQGFIPPDINMGSRNAMRDCMAPLVALGEECGTTFLVICHTNKRNCAYGRDRIADSADLWDISRSVLMAGYTQEQGVRYLSNEKNNYTQLQETILFSINDFGIIQPMGTTWKRDREYVQDKFSSTSKKPKRDGCKEFVLNELAEANGLIKVQALDKSAQNAGYSKITLRRAKDELKADNKIKYIQTGKGKGKVWSIQQIIDVKTQDRQREEIEQMKL